nr:immunoglobulin light chain junction region [Macaca mulatta]
DYHCNSYAGSGVYIF